MPKSLACLLLLLGFFPRPGLAETFQNPSRLILPNTPDLVLHGDLNGDGKDDIVYSDTSGLTTLHTLLNQGGGTYKPGPVLTLPRLVYDSCILADFNGDHKPDLACNYQSDVHASMVFFAGNGDGSFAAPKYVPLPDSPYLYFYLRLYSSGDLNGDGVPDMLAGDGQNGWSWPILSDGAGGFKIGPRQSVLAGTFIDINGDGKIDDVSAGGQVAYGNGDGTFQGYSSSAIPIHNQCAFGDVDGDGHVDAVCVYTENYQGDITGAWDLQIFHGNPDGTFAGTPEYKRVFGDKSNEYENDGTLGAPILIADINHDGYPDIVTSALDGITILTGGPGLTFSDPRHWVAGSPFGNLGFVADINGDGFLDFVSAATNGIFFAYSRPDGSLKSAEAFEVTGVIGYAAVADFNGDGIPDVVTSGDHALTLALGNGDGTFQPYTKIQPGVNYYSGLYGERVDAQLLHGDFNGDGKEDIIAYGSTDVNGFNSQYYYFQGKGDGTFLPQVPVKSDYPYGGRYDVTHVYDLNGDKRADILHAPDTSKGVLHVQLSNGDGSFTTKDAPVIVEQEGNGFAYTETTPAAADFDGDGKLDLVYASHSNAYVLHGKGDGTFTPGATLAIPPFAGATSQSNAIAVTTGDFDGDGHQDIAVLWGAFLYGIYGSATTQTLIFYGNGDGTFSAPVVANFGANGYADLKAADLNRDGRDEIILHGEGSLNGGNGVGILHGSANRTFATQIDYSANNGLSSLQIADLNHDGFLDLVFANGDYNGPANSVTVLLNLGDSPQVTGVLNASPEPSYAGAPFSISAVLAAPDNSALTGQVDFLLDGTSAGSAQLSGNVATLPIARPLSLGNHSLQADWAGQTPYGSVSLTGTHVVAAIPTSLSLGGAPSPSNVGDLVRFNYSLSAVSATTGAGGTLTITDNGAVLATVTLANSPLPFTGVLSEANLTVGTHNIVALYSGDGTYAAASASFTQVVLGLPVTIRFASLPNPSPVGQAVTLTASLASMPCSGCSFSGTITFADGQTTLASSPVAAAGSNSAVISFSTAGDHVLTATYSGDTVYQPASATSTQHVLRTDTALLLASSPNPSTFGSPVVLTATARVLPSGAAATGTTISFMDGSLVLGSSPVDATGHAILQIVALQPGSHTITATLAQTASLNLSSAYILQVVNQAPTLLTLSASPNPAFQLQPVSLTANLAAVGGSPVRDTVQFTEGSLLLGSASVTGSPAALTLTTLSVGTHQITANFAGNAQYLAATSATLNVTIQASDFIVTPSDATLQIQTGHHLTFSAQAVSAGRFADNLAWTAENLPSHMTVRFTPASSPLAAGATSTVSIYLETDDVFGYKSSLGSRPAPWVLCLLLPCLAVSRRRKHVVFRAIALAFCLASLLQLTGCSGKFPASVDPNRYVITLRATGAATGVSHTAQVAVQVLP